MNHWNSQRYHKEGRAANKNSGLLQRAVATADVIRAKNPHAPIILTLKHLAHETDVPYDFLRSVVERDDESDGFYRVFTVKKNNVGHAVDRTRTICAPHPLLLRAQRWIHTNILRFGRFHEAACAYRPGAKILDAAALHCEARWMVKMDVSNFFESILENQVYKVFRSFGYQPLVAFELTRICTRVRKGSPARSPSTMPRILTYANRQVGHLPQGAPTSPLLANLVAFNLDVELAELAQSHDMVYTRYADDVTFSTSISTWSRAKAVQLLKDGHTKLKEHGFWPNHAKAHIVAPGARKIVLGLSVQGPLPGLTKDFKNKLRAHIHYLQRFQFTNCPPHLKLGFDSILGLQRHVFGLAYFAIGIDKTWGAARLAELKAIAWPTEHGISFD
jgi:hypothetical protein